MAALRQQFALSQSLADALRRDMGLIDEVRKLRKDRPQDERVAALEGAAEERRPWARQEPPALVPWNARIAGIYDLLQSTDAPPTPQAVQAAEKVLREAAELFARAQQVLRQK